MPQRLRVHAQVLVVMAMLGVIRAQGGDLADGHIFFYLWYGNPETDGRYMHWNHKVLPHWTESVNAQFPSVGKAFEPREIHAPFYPQRGCYSSRSTETLEAQFAEIRGTGVGVAVVSWWGAARSTWRGRLRVWVRTTQCVVLDRSRSCWSSHSVSPGAIPRAVCQHDPPGYRVHCRKIRE